MIIFSGTANPQLAQSIAKHMGLSVSESEIHVFPDGEKRVRILESAIDKDVVVVQPTGSPVDTNYMELFFLTDAIKRNGAKSITVVIPYLGYQRQDHLFRIGEAVSLDVVISMLQATGVTRVITFDLHSIKIAEEFKIQLSHLSALQLFAEKIKKEGWNTGDTVLVSPDMGGIRRIKILSEMLDNMPHAAIEKDRDLESGTVTAGIVHGEAKKRALIVDDIIASGKTIAVAADLLKKNGTNEIQVFATHAVFSKEAPQILQNAQIEAVFVTDTITVPKENHFAKLAILSVAGMIATQLAAA